MFIKDNAFFKKNQLINISFKQISIQLPPLPSPLCILFSQSTGTCVWKERDSASATLTGKKQESHAWLDRLRLWWLLASFPPEAELPACLPADVLLLALEEMLVWRMTHYYPLISVSACWASNWNILNRCKNTCEPGRTSCAALCFIYPWCEP